MDESNGHGVSAMTDAQLINGMCDPGCGPEHLRLLRGELYTRYAPGLHAHCIHKYGDYLSNEELRLEFVDDVLMAFFRTGVRRFNLSVAASEEEIPKLIRCWLARIAKWQFLSRLKQVRLEEISSIDLETAGPTPGSTIGECVDRLSQQQQQFRQMQEHLAAVISKMGERVRDVVYTSFKFYDGEKNKFLIPSDVQQQLCERWGFRNHNTLIKFRTRSITRIKIEMTERVEVA